MERVSDGECDRSLLASLLAVRGEHLGNTSVSWRCLLLPAVATYEWLGVQAFGMQERQRRATPCSPNFHGKEGVVGSSPTPGFSRKPKLPLDGGTPA